MKVQIALLFVHSLLAFAALLPVSPSIPSAYHRPEGVKLIEDEFLVILHEGHTIDSHFRHINNDLSQNASMFWPIETINGYRVRIDPKIIHESIRLDPMVELVEQDHIIASISEDSSDVPFVQHDIGRNRAKDLAKRGDPFIENYGHKHREDFWFADQVSANEKLSIATNGNDRYAYRARLGAGHGVNIYILDTGIRLSHSDFAGRASNFRGMKVSKYVGGSMDDYQGHGTHVAGIAAGALFGMAPSAKLINVKIICGKKDPAECRPSNAAMVHAVSDVTSEHNNHKKTSPKGWKGSVINASLQSTSTVGLKRAITAAHAAGIPVVAAAGNAGHAAIQAPCIFASVCVASSDRYYRKSWFSNYVSEALTQYKHEQERICSSSGPHIDIVALGSHITSASNTADDRFVQRSGTSMATPLVAGVMAIYVGLKGIKDDASKVVERLTHNAIKDIIDFGRATSPPTRNLFLNLDVYNRWQGVHMPHSHASYSRLGRVKGRSLLWSKNESINPLPAT